MNLLAFLPETCLSAAAAFDNNNSEETNVREQHDTASADASLPKTEVQTTQTEPTTGKDPTLEFALCLVKIIKVHVTNKNCKHCKKIVDETFAMTSPAPTAEKPPQAQQQKGQEVTE